jgi:Tripartite tricarboxylate transporter family receptor/Bacterial regulatory proteins, lacI family
MKPESTAVRRACRGSGAVTLYDVARLAGVAPITASRALNTPGQVSAQMLKKVTDAVLNTGYVPNRVAGGLASARSRLVAALVPTLSGPVFQETIKALHEALVERGYQLMLGQSGYAVMQHIKSGKLRALAITSAKRSALLPDVPTLAEAAVKNVEVDSWQAVVAPKGLPADVRSTAHAAIVAALNAPKVKEQFVSVGFEVVANTPAQFAAFQQQEFARWKKVIETGKITID